MMTTDISASENTFFGHPKALFILFFTEMWERFSFYGMKALLIFYLTKYHLFSDINGNLLIGSYAALVYAVPVIGGFIADKYLGFRKAIVFGGIMLVLGHMGMAYEGNAATQSVTGEITVIPDDEILLTSAVGSDNQIVCENIEIDEIVPAKSGFPMIDNTLLLAVPVAVCVPTDKPPCKI